MENKLNVLILAGGDSEEKEVSLASSKAIFQALNRLGYNAWAIDIASGISLIDAKGEFSLEEDKTSSSKIAMVSSSSTSTSLTTISDYAEKKKVDLVFLGLHGGRGEDGTVQAVLELAGMKYTGSGHLASAVAMDKAFTKSLLNSQEIPTPSWMLIKNLKNKDIEKYIGKINNRFGYPIIVKPNNSGSTCGLTLVKEEKALGKALKDSREVSPDILIEKYIKGSEITASILDGEPLPLVEIVPSNELYDYQCKYTKGKSQYICPAPIPTGVAKNIQNLALRAYEIIGCSGLARVDFRALAAAFMSRPVFMR